MLVIPEEHVKQIFAIAKQSHPIEACGVIVANRANPQQTRLVHMRNAANSPEFFQFDPGEQLKLWREVEDKEEFLWVIFHSHTGSEAYPSRADVNFASEPDSHYVIVSTDDSVSETIRSFRISSQRVVEENVRISK